MENQLEKWLSDYDNGNVMHTGLMGGISLSYEHAIQELAIEIMRTLSKAKLSDVKEVNNHNFRIAKEKAVSKMNLELGLSGAQAGAAGNLASVFWVNSPEKAIEMLKEREPTRVMTIRKAENGRVLIVDYDESQFTLDVPTVNH